MWLLVLGILLGVSVGVVGCLWVRVRRKGVVQSGAECLGILDALPFPVALSESGAIVFGNGAWQRLTEKVGKIARWDEWLRQSAVVLSRPAPAFAVVQGSSYAETLVRLPGGRSLRWVAVPFTGLGRRLVLNVFEDLSVFLPDDLQAQADFLNRAMHELKTPITAIKGFAELVQMNAERGRTLDLSVAMRIVQQSNRLVHLLNQLLDVSRVQADRLKDEPELVRLDERLSDAITRLHTLYPDRIIHVEAAQLQGLIDPDRFEHLVRELVLNAVQYSKPQAPVFVRLEATDDMVRLRVRDLGIGILPEDRLRIFGCFERGRNAGEMPGAGGFGLGLYLVQAMLARWGGRIWCESEPGKGSEFIAEWPLRRLPAHRREQAEPEALARHGSKPDRVG